MDYRLQLKSCNKPLVLREVTLLSDCVLCPVATYNSQLLELLQACTASSMVIGYCLLLALLIDISIHYLELVTSIYVFTCM